MSGVYVHIPFCKSFCIYCDFYSVLEKEKTDSYICTLLKEISVRKDFFKSGQCLPETLYFGGGTPSVLSLERLKTISEAVIRTFFNGHLPTEFTMEVNPDDITLEYATALKSLGVNRISMGVQSFDDKNLLWMHRRHTSEGAIKAFRTLRSAGFENISLDLIFGYLAQEDSQTGTTAETSVQMKSWLHDLETITGLHPEHISAYQMSIEPGSALAARKQYKEPQQEYCAKQYSLLRQKLAEAGYIQYEISNFSLPGCHSRHNSSYWEREPYIGLGPAAHSFKGRTRSWNPADLDKYSDLFSAKSAEAPWEIVLNPSIQALSETLTEEEILEEEVMLGLRKTSGIPYNDEFSKLKNLRSMENRGLLIIENGRIKIPSDKLFISDYIISELIS